jgi:SnoaL-like protein
VPDSIAPELQYLLDRTAIMDCMVRYSRGLDRHDEDLIASAFWDDAIDNHGDFVGNGRELAIWGNELHAQKWAAHQHFITTHSCEIDGDIAHAETYWLVVLKHKGAQRCVLSAGRYVDRLERRGGTWKIAVRQAVNDRLLVEAEGEHLIGPGFGDYMKGTWDRGDISYARPLTIEREHNPIGGWVTTLPPSVGFRGA